MNIQKKEINNDIILSLLEQINNISGKPVRIMEVCGGHTMSIHKNGIPSLLPDNISLVSGPGCPVCVTPTEFIDKCIAASDSPEIIITSYGDLLKVPGSDTTLMKKKSVNRNIRIVYSILDALKIAEENPEKKVIFPGIGFETTSPATAAALIEADQKNIDNFYIFSSHKIMKPAMEALAAGEGTISAYLCPGHVSVITGTEIYNRIASDFKIPCVVSGFEAADILISVLYILKQIDRGKSEVEITYKRAVKQSGNIKAQKLLSEVFNICDSEWRGLGIIPDSGLCLKDKYRHRDAELLIPENIAPPKVNTDCRCGEILKGIKSPPDCPLFASVCNPSDPAGACMVSSEGSCAAWYRYSR